MGFYKRKVLAVVLAVALILCCFIGCKDSIPPVDDKGLTPPVLEPPTNGSGQNEFDGLSVYFLDVGQGDCILICFPDKTNMLIDCGNGSPESVDNISTAFNIRNIDTLDYLVLTHPDVDHVGGVEKALKDIDVKKVYHPDVDASKVGFDEYFSAMEFLVDKDAETAVSLSGISFGEEYKLVFLLPYDRRMSESSYKDFLFALEPTEKQINDISPYIYLEYKGIRFLFTGDCSTKQEKLLTQDYQVLLKRFAIKLEHLDFLKVAHHGSDDSTGYEFLSLTRPKNAIISVGGDNFYGHPASSVLKRLENVNPNYNLFRTDVSGTVSVFVSEDGEVLTKTARGEKEKT